MYHTSYPPVLGFSAEESVGDVWSFDNKYKNVLELQEINGRDLIKHECKEGFYKEKKKVLLMSSITGGESNQK